MHFSKGTIVIFVGWTAWNCWSVHHTKGAEFSSRGLLTLSTLIVCAVNVFVSSTFYCLSCIKEDSHPFVSILNSYETIFSGNSLMWLEWNWKLLLDNHSAEIKFIIKGNPNMKSLYVTGLNLKQTNKQNPNVVLHYVKKQVKVKWWIGHKMKTLKLERKPNNVFNW